ncbi:hypothetical protein D3C83_191440 [compost metagenome]
MVPVTEIVGPLGVRRRVLLEPVRFAQESRVERFGGRALANFKRAARARRLGVVTEKRVRRRFRFAAGADDPKQ